MCSLACMIQHLSASVLLREELLDHLQELLGFFQRRGVPTAVDDVQSRVGERLLVEFATIEGMMASYFPQTMRVGTFTPRK